MTGNQMRWRRQRVFTSLLVSLSMMLGVLAIVSPTPARAALGVNDFEMGADESLGVGSESTDIVDVSNGGSDWASLAPVSGDFEPGEVVVINDQNYVGLATVGNPETNATTYCTTENDLIVKNGTKIDDFPFPVVDGSPSPGKNDICQVYIAYDFAGGDALAYIGVLRRDEGGTTAIAIELNKVNQANRQIDDLLIMFEFDGSGPVSNLAVRSWDGSTWGDPVALNANEWDGASWEYFGEVVVNLSATGLLPPPTAVDDCDSFSSIAPYGVAGNSTNSNVGDWGGEHPITIPRCGALEITKVASPAADSSYVFGWTITDNDPQPLDPASDSVLDGETDTIELVNGEYTLTESTFAPPYVLDRIECFEGQRAVDPSEIVIAVGTKVSCTIYNEASQVQVVKAGAGDATADFGFSVTGQSDFQLSLGDSSGLFLYAPDSAVTVTETLPGGLPDWDLTAISCTDSQGADAPNLLTSIADGSASFSTASGDLITCTFTNEQDAKITVVKNVVNDDGGTAVIGDFDLYLNGNSVISGAANHVEAGTYTVSEDGVDGYTQVSIVCLDDDSGSDVGHPVTLAKGQAVTCTVTNDDVAPLLTLEKVVVNDEGGEAVDTDWTLSADGPDSISGVEGDAAVTSAAVEAGDYDLDESNGPAGYSPVGWDCGEATMVDGDTVTLGVGDVVTCTVTNDDLEASITVVKVVLPETSAQPDDFGLIITPESEEPIVVSSGASQAVPANQTYTIGETLLDGFVQLELVCEDDQGSVAHPVELALGQHVTCTITNAESPTVTVVKATDPLSTNLFSFTLNPGNTQQVLGNSGSYTWTALEPGNYQLTEDTPVDWSLETVECDAEVLGLPTGAGITLDWGDHVTCVFSNGELGSITVVKKVDVTTDDLFDVQIKGGPVAESVALGEGDSHTWDLLAPGEYTVAETIANLEWDISLVCSGDSVVGPESIANGGKSRAVDIDLGFGDHVTCTFTNEAAAADLEVTKIDLVDPVLVTDTRPTALIEYEINVENNGPGIARDIVVTDTLPDTLTFVSVSTDSGVCAHASGVITCELGKMEVGDTVTISVMAETERVGEITDLDPENVVRVDSATEDPNPQNDTDEEITSIEEILPIVVLPFTGIHGDLLTALALLLLGLGVVIVRLLPIMRIRGRHTYPAGP